MIKPTIGRQVWFWPAKVSGGVLINHGGQPMAATVTYVFGDRMVNLQILDHGSHAHALTSVPLLQDDDERPDGYFCEWMPFQKGQAAKTEQLETATKYTDGGTHTLTGLPHRAGETLDQAHERLGHTAARVTQADLEANIAHEYYFTAEEGVRGSQIGATGPTQGLVEPLHLLTFCVLVLRNGFTVTGVSAPASPANFNAELGQRLARENAVRALWPLMGYALRERLHRIDMRYAADFPGGVTRVDER